VTRFDYLHDAVPEFVNVLRSLRVPRPFYNVAAGLITIVIVSLVTSGIENVRVRAAQSLEAKAQARFERSRRLLEEARLHWKRLDEMVREDGRLRALRLSGPRMAERVAHMGNAFPDGVWLTSLTSSGSGYALKGNAATLRGFESALARLLADGALSQPQIVRVSRPEAAKDSPLTFDVETAEK
jgi:type IV pilus assembly PilN-like protein